MDGAYFGPDGPDVHIDGAQRGATREAALGGGSDSVSVTTGLVIAAQVSL